MMNTRPQTRSPIAARAGVMPLLFALALLAQVLPASAAQAVLQPGAPAQAFSKPTTAGKAFTLDHQTSGAALAKARGITLPEAVTGTPDKPNMTLQVGRRMAARGLWEDALKYYTEAARKIPLPAAA